MSKLSIPKLVKAETRVAHIKQLTTRIGDQIRMVGRSSSPPQSTASRIGNASHRHRKDSHEGNGQVVRARMPPGPLTGPSAEFQQLDSPCWLNAHVATARDAHATLASKSRGHDDATSKD
ncbi:hypothetical protein ACVIGB_009960 [Bradyrhizobium sp. USDA 4341]